MSLGHGKSAMNLCTIFIPYKVPFDAIELEMFLIVSNKTDVLMRDARSKIRHCQPIPR